MVKQEGKKKAVLLLGNAPPGAVCSVESCGKPAPNKMMAIPPEGSNIVAYCCEDESHQAACLHSINDTVAEMFTSSEG
jgi:hypothetical protein